MKELIEFLNKIYPISDAATEYLHEHLKVIEVKKKDFILKKGRICYNIYYVEKGLLRCYYLKSGRQVNSWFMKEHDVIFSVESFLNQTPSYENIQALEDSLLYYIDYDEIQYLYKNCLEFNFIGRVVTENYYKLSEQRLYSLRMQKAAERYDFILNHFPQIVLRVPSKYIASYLGITEETLSRIRALKANN